MKSLKMRLKKALGLDQRIDVVSYMISVHQISQRQACGLLSVDRTTFEYVKQPKGDELIIDQLRQLVDKHPSIGF